MDLIGHFFMDNFGSELSQESLQNIGESRITIDKIIVAFANGVLVTATF